jgi:methyl coenzyme M reductase subunit C-like uncharacterized protein (methanogenesis marker protein 7)
MLEPMMYEGGVFKHNLVEELVEDLGGYILQKNIMQTEVVLIMLVPIKDTGLVEDMTKKLLGELTRAPLSGTEIAVVAPTLAYHHLPHPDCDIAEFLRRKGAKTMSFYAEKVQRPIWWGWPGVWAQGRARYLHMSVN